MDEKVALDMFGEYLIKKVRYEAIDSWERKSKGKMKDTESQEIFQVLLQSFTLEQRTFIENLFPKIVDTTLHHLLWSLEEEKNIDVIVELDNSVRINIREASDGLAGELYTEDGWISRYSNN
ncbi:epimerase [Paenibacillus macerans]|uniref:epimerase n=1 Tax=Paenibacillus macerans TaxID=44252 RepID=UPI003D312089